MSTGFENMYRLCSGPSISQKKQWFLNMHHSGSGLDPFCFIMSKDIPIFQIAQNWSTILKMNSEKYGIFI